MAKKENLESERRPNMKRVALFAALGIGAVAIAAFAMQAQRADEPRLDPSKPEVTVYKSPTCACCTKWEGHLRASGFNVVSEEMNNVSPMKQRLGLPNGLASCHTAVVGGYVVEGHVPADLIHRLLEEKPDIVGIAVPGMPIGSPGMEGPNPEPYDIIAFHRDGSQEVFASR